MNILALRHNLCRMIEAKAFNIRVMYLHLKGMRVTVGDATQWIGIPRLQLEKGSELKIGNACIFRSNPDSNPIGVDQPVTFCTLKPDARITIGDSVGMSGGSICARNYIKIGNGTLIGANVYIFDTDFHPIDQKSREANIDSMVRSSGVTIGNNCFIGTRSIILKGVSIGDNTVVGAGSVVTRSLPHNVVASGNPCRVIRTI